MRVLDPDTDVLPHNRTEDIRNPCTRQGVTVATSLKALKDKLPIPALAEWLLSKPDHLQNMYEIHSPSVDTGLCAECHDIAPCKFRMWAEEAKEYIEYRDERMRNQGTHYV